jgi:hypothetical protein
LATLLIWLDVTEYGISMASKAQTTAVTKESNEATGEPVASKFANINL